jgi:hypothetical protein
MAFGESGGFAAASARVVLGVDTREFDRDLPRAERQFHKATQGMNRDMGQLVRGGALGTGAFQGFSRMIAVASASMLGAAGFTAVVTKSVAAASNLNEAINKSNETFKDAAPTMRIWAEEAARTLGMSERAALENAGSIGAMLIPMGIAPTSAANMSRAMVQLAADMGSFNNVDPSEMLDKIRSGLAGQSDALLKYGVDLRASTVEQYALDQGLIKQGETLNSTGRLWAAYELLLKQTKIQQKDFGRTADGAANAQRTFTAMIEEAEAALGAALLPVLETLLPKLTEWAESVRDNKELHQDLVGFIEDTVDVLETSVDVIDDVTEAVGGMKNAFELLFALAIVSKVGRMTGAFTALAGAEAAGAAAAGGTGLAGAAGKAGLLLRTMKFLGALAVTKIVINFIAGDVDLPSARDYARKGQLGSAALALIGEDELAARVAGVGMPGPGAGGPGDVVIDPRNVGGQAKPSGKGANFIYAAGTKFTVGGGPGQGTHNQKDWQSGNAIDIFAAPGTPVLSPVDGKIISVSGRDPDMGTLKVGTKVTYGYGVTIAGYAGMTYWLGHLDNVTVKAGDTVKRGQVIGSVARWKGGKAHVHVGVPWGQDPKALLLSGRGTLDPEKKKTETGDVPTPEDLTQDKPDKKPKTKKTSKTDDPVLNRLELKLAIAEDTKRLDDDLAALNAIDKYLTKKIAVEKKAKEKARLIRERQSVRSDITEVTQAIRDKRPLPKITKLPGLAQLLGDVDQLASGTGEVDLGGKLGKVLVPHSLKPTIAAWKKLVAKLKLKLKAALGRRTALTKTLQRLGRVKGKLRDVRMIQNTQQRIAALNNEIADIRGAIGEGLAAIDELAAEAASQAQEDADEAERVAAEAADEAERAEVERADAQKAEHDAYQQSLIDTPPDTRLKMALAEGTETKADDIEALQIEKARITSILSRGDLDIETRITLVNALNSVNRNLESIFEEVKKSAEAATILVDYEKSRQSFLEGLQALRADQSNIFSPLRSLQGSNLQVTNYFAGPPADSHLWSKETEFELRVILG